MHNPPLILTTLLNKHHSDYFNILRQKYFPPERNLIDAHLTLFHALPNESTVIDIIKQFCFNQLPFTMHVRAPVSIGKGVAFKIESPELMKLHKKFQGVFFNELSPQDKHTIWPHITIQNKVSAGEASQLLNELKKDFVAFDITVTGLQLWEYLGGPWKFVETIMFEIR